ncbi:FliH/SctL family protein [Paenibacillus sediminis]|uniref:Flagellar assembly protein FliH n=1 Tax=Paenibacillus sediminis TaxID=664909 RepID=A0ABS4H1T3_9BACL|nr:FliH/SctL family protein [Paenibacillus sediminis]MBP1936426.1 flagellar assembly protein FliH [Paenibacillus sediminis]
MSNLIKSSYYVPVEVLKQLNLGKYYGSESDEASQETDSLITEKAFIDEETEKVKTEILKDAQEFAERQVREASEEAERILEEAKSQIELWWQERREQDEHLIEALKAEGFEKGYEEGRIEAQKSLQAKVNEMMEEAQEVLKHAYQVKEQIIQEAEPFLVELSSAIAEKIIDKQLSIEPEYAIEWIKSHLSRKREQGVITLCVSPSQFSFVHAAREELNLAIDSQAELQIIPDASVKDRGCVIRSSFGSVDARIDTQLTEIKKELLRIALQSEEREDQNEGA